MSVLSSTQKRRRRIPNKVKFQSMGDHDEFLSRIKKTLYYGKIPLTERFSLPVSELAAELYSNVKSEHCLERLCVEETADISRNACVSPCSLILALFYLERLKTCNPDYVDRVSPSELFVVSMMVASKFLHDDGEEDEVFNTEWATSAGIGVSEINRYEKDFLNAIKWEVFVSESEFWSGLSKLEKEVARREVRRRGWFSYTEMIMLSDVVDAWSLAHTLAVVSVVCLTSYTASVLTLLGSAFISTQITANIIPSTISSQTSLPVQPISYTEKAQPTSDDINSIITSDSFIDTSNLTCLKSATDLKEWNSCTEVLTTNTEKSLSVPNLLSFSSLWYRLTKSIDNISSNLYYGSLTKDDGYKSLLKLNETKSGLMDLIKMVILAMESEKTKSYNVIDYFMKNVVVNSESMITSSDGDNNYNQLSYFLRTLKLPA